MNKQQIQQKIQKWQQVNHNAGYTIMEGLVAMVMVAFLMSAVAPVIALSVGTRVQARRVELAAQAARSYIDGVRAGSIPAPTGNFIGGGETSFGVSTFDSCTPTDTAPYCDNPTILQGRFYCVDGDGDGKCTSDSLTDMMVHAAAVGDPDIQPLTYITQLTGADSEEMAKIGYLLSVRVYRASAFKDAEEISREAPTTSISNTGLATRSGSTERPLFITKTEIAPTNLKGSFQRICERLDKDGTNCP